MPRFGLATLNHSPLHGLPAQMSMHLDAVRGAGFDAIAPDIFWLRALERNGIRLEALSEALEERGIACMEISGLALATPEQTAAELEENLRYARILGAELVNTRVVTPPTAAVAALLCRCAEALAETGARIALEFSSGSQLVDIAAACELLLAAGQIDPQASARIGITLDTWHFFQASGGPDWQTLDALPLEALANVQLSDGVAPSGRAYGDETMNHRRLPGAGDFDLARCAECLREKGFDGAVVVEVLNADLRRTPIDEFAHEAGLSSRAWWTGREPQPSTESQPSTQKPLQRAPFGQRGRA